MSPEPPRRSGWQPPGRTPDDAAPKPVPPSRPVREQAAKPAPDRPRNAPRPNPPSQKAPSRAFAAKSTPDLPQERASATQPPNRRRPAAPTAKPQASPARVAARRRGGFRVPGGLRGPALVSRGARALFWTLLAAVLAMTVYLVRYRERVDAHFEARAQAVPLADATAGGASAPLTLYVASDDTGALTTQTVTLPLPNDANTRARVVLEKLLAEYTEPGSSHPLKPTAPGVGSVDEVFLSPVRGGRGQLATVDLTPEFVRLHPSGIEPETLTLLSMIATLHATLPAVSEVHFLVDGEQRPTLAGHADLTRTYLSGSVQMAQPVAFTGAR